MTFFYYQGRYNMLVLLLLFTSKLWCYERITRTASAVYTRCGYNILCHRSLNYADNSRIKTCIQLYTMMWFVSSWYLIDLESISFHWELWWYNVYIPQHQFQCTGCAFHSITQTSSAVLRANTIGRLSTDKMDIWTPKTTERETTKTAE